MINVQKKKLYSIINDKTSGSTEILLSLNSFLKNCLYNKKLFENSILEAKDLLSHFAIIDNYLTALNNIVIKKDFDTASRFLNNIERTEKEKFENIFRNLLKEMPKAKDILTMSRSGTLIRVFKLWKKRKRNLNLIIAESRPSNEGKSMAKELLNAGIKVELITDAMTGNYIPRIDAVAVGADVVLKNGNVINKSGSLSLAVLCKYYKKPFYVLSAKSKFINKTKYKIIRENPDRVWSYKHPNLITSNIPFEEIEKKLITKIISE